jgi:hypothetical protein
LRQKFTSLTVRRRPVFPDHVLSGIEVDASSPEEMVAETERALIAMTKGEPEN